MELHAGTSGFSYRGWRGGFYPPGLPQDRLLSWYARVLGAVEIDSTFYRLPSSQQLEKWAHSVPAGFRFSFKAPGRITHQLKLASAADITHAFAERVAALHPRAPVLFQLPPWFHADAERLERFLSMLPEKCRAAFEFRHPSWFEPQVLDVLRRHRAALCVAEAEKLATPWIPTADWGYVRLRLPDYSDADLERRARKIAEQPWSEAFAFFKHEDAAKGPAFARTLVDFFRRHPAVHPG